MVLMVVYHINGDFLVGNDAKPNVYLPAQILQNASLSFTPEQQPFMFVWQLETPKGPGVMRFPDWDSQYPQIGPVAMSQLRDAGKLSMLRPIYYLTPSSVQPGRYVNTFGPGAGLTALPLFTALHLATGDLMNSPKALWYGGKFVASALVAGSAVCVFLTAAVFTTRWRALVIAGAYGLGTCVWSVSSQTLWQHGPNEFFLALGTLFLVHMSKGRKFAAFCALAYAAAVVCRPTSALVVIAVGLYLAAVTRRVL